MAKFYGKIGYSFTGETVPGVWVDDFIEKDVVGDWLKNTRQLVNSNQVNDDITVNNLVSIVADPYALSNFTSIIYCIWKGVKVNVNSVEIQHPRIILSLGGEYNEQST